MKKADKALILERGTAHARAWLAVAERHGEVYHVTHNGKRSSLTYCARFYTIDQPPADELLIATGMVKRPELVDFWPRIEDMSGLSCDHSEAWNVLRLHFGLDMKTRGFRGGGSGVFGIFYGIALAAGMPDAHSWAGKIRLTEIG
jgi:hypothetical protein